MKKTWNIPEVEELDLNQTADRDNANGNSWGKDNGNHKSKTWTSGDGASNRGRSGGGENPIS